MENALESLIFAMNYAEWEPNIHAIVWAQGV